MSIDQILGWVSEWGSFGLFPLLALGIVGLPIPDESLLASAGFLVARGELRLVPTVLFAFLGSITGITLSYLIGRLGGGKLLDRYGHLVHLDHSARKNMQAWFERWGTWALILCYFIPGVRHFGALVAGMSGLRYPTFSLFAYTGALFWTTSFIGAGYLLEHEWDQIEHVVRPHLVGIGFTVIVAMIIEAVWLLSRNRSR